MGALQEKLGDHQSQQDSSSGEHERLYKISRWSIQRLLKRLTTLLGHPSSTVNTPCSLHAEYIRVVWLTYVAHGDTEGKMKGKNKGKDGRRGVRRFSGLAASLSVSVCSRKQSACYE